MLPGCFCLLFRSAVWTIADFPLIILSMVIQNKGFMDIISFVLLFLLFFICSGNGVSARSSASFRLFRKRSRKSGSHALDFLFSFVNRYFIFQKRFPYLRRDSVSPLCILTNSTSAFTANQRGGLICQFQPIQCHNKQFYIFHLFFLLRYNSTKVYSFQIGYFF